VEGFQEGLQTADSEGSPKNNYAGALR